MWLFASKRDVHQEADQIRVDMRAMQQSLLNALQQIHPPTLPQSFYSIPSRLDKVEQRVSDLVKEVHELTLLLQQLSATSVSGDQKPIDGMIKARINAALAAIHALGNEHSRWLEAHRVSHDGIQQAIDDLQQRHKASAHHVFPPEEEKEINTEPVL